MVRWGRVTGFLLIVVLTFTTIGLTTDNVLEDVILGLDLKGGFEILYQVNPLEGETITPETMKNTVSALERRISVIGVAEPEIQIEGKDRIRIKLAGVFDQDKARKLLGSPAKLTFRNMDGEILMTGKDLVENGAGIGYDQLNQPLVTLKLKDPEKFANITRQYLEKPIAIYLDETMLTAPIVKAVITGGEATIDGQRTVDEAKELAALLNAGALPVDLKEIYSNSVGAKLGSFALKNTVKAGIIGTILIFLFMIVYYRLPGLVATITLSAYIYLVLRIFTWMGATLTLPGIAAFILGIGMAVDANIITYERIKDELRSGKTILSALRAGSRRSFGTIFDANLTTILAALVLFYFGSSAIQGFAITLITSILVSFFTAVFGSRILLNLLVRGNVGTKPWYYGVKESEISEL
ncbi:protein translocase subunit SecD [Microaerobacter geothermalis]|uniref:protein translocase subunit SecD n=1 Tax=Microaerobacter geothermalis TaxID=674972 RepID=UPI001F1C7A26|nr:protein translocase subunit SecD [Microaerobacter geothermalis]MCF6092760.1 protein translocase subunit SecD [Microaerobacter geothermalis]